MINIDKVGKILAGENYKGWYIKFEKIENDAFLILYNISKDFKGEGYDDWVKDYNELERYIEEAGLQIEWKE